MRIPRISLLETMAAVGLVAVDCGVVSFLIRDEQHSGKSPWLDVMLLMTLPMANALAVGLYVRFKSRAARRRRGRFLSGFLLAGSASLIVATLASAIVPFALLNHVSSVFRPIEPILQRISQDNPALRDSVLVPAVIAGIMIYLAIPQILLALAVGWFTRRYEIKLIRRPDRPAPSPTGAADAMIGC